MSVGLFPTVRITRLCCDLKGASSMEEFTFIYRRQIMFGLTPKCACGTVAVWIALAGTLVYATYLMGN